MSYRRFESLLRESNSTVYRVAKETGIPASTFTDWKNGRSVPKAEKLRKLAAYFGVPMEALMEEGGVQTMPYEKRREKRIPIIGEIRAGSPIITDQTLLGYETAEVEDADEYFYLKILGDSMKNIGMINGSLVLFRKQQYAENGDVVACLVGGDSATVKRFRREKRTVYLTPENEDYQPILLTTDDFESGEARILGVAREVKIKL